MGLGGASISSWDDMKTTFLEKCHDYCWTRDQREELFRMSHREEEIL